MVEHCEIVRLPARSESEPPQSFVPILREIRAILRERRMREAEALAQRPRATVIAFPGVPVGEG